MLTSIHTDNKVINSNSVHQKKQRSRKAALAPNAVVVVEAME